MTASADTAPAHCSSASIAFSACLATQSLGVTTGSSSSSDDDDDDDEEEEAYGKNEEGDVADDDWWSSFALLLLLLLLLLCALLFLTYSVVPCESTFTNPVLFLPPSLSSSCSCTWNNEENNEFTPDQQQPCDDPS
jgi:hypothetical protein